MSRHKSLKGLIAESYYDDEQGDSYGEENAPVVQKKEKKTKPKKGLILSFTNFYLGPIIDEAEIKAVHDHFQGFFTMQ